MTIHLSNTSTDKCANENIVVLNVKFILYTVHSIMITV